MILYAYRITCESRVPQSGGIPHLQRRYLGGSAAAARAPNWTNQAPFRLIEWTGREGTAASSRGIPDQRAAVQPSPSMCFSEFSSYGFAFIGFAVSGAPRLSRSRAVAVEIAPLRAAAFRSLRKPVGNTSPPPLLQRRCTRRLTAHVYPTLRLPPLTAALLSPPPLHSVLAPQAELPGRRIGARRDAVRYGCVLLRAHGAPPGRLVLHRPDRRLD